MRVRLPNLAATYTWLHLDQPEPCTVGVIDLDAGKVFVEWNARLNADGRQVCRPPTWANLDRVTFDGLAVVTAIAAAQAAA